MQKQAKIYPSLALVALATGLLLMVPFIAMQFTNEVNWSATDFIIMGILLFSAGASYVVVARHAVNLVHRLAVVSAIGSTFVLIFVNLAVGIIGSGPNPGNLLYIAVVLLVITGTFVSRFTPRGMELTMFASAFSVMLIAIIALVVGMQAYPGSSALEIVAVNVFFLVLFGLSGLLFRVAGMLQTARPKVGN